MQKDLFLEGIAGPLNHVQAGLPIQECGVSVTFLRKLQRVANKFDELTTAAWVQTVVAPLAAKSGRSARYAT